jgi:hypothetical protein
MRVLGSHSTAQLLVYLQLLLSQRFNLKKAVQMKKFVLYKS